MMEDRQGLDAMRIAKWVLATRPKFRARAMRCGGFGEVVSRAMVIAIEYKNPRKFTLATVVVNSVRFALRHLEVIHCRRAKVIYEEADLDQLPVQPIDWVCLKELHETIGSVLQGLPYREREILTLRYGLKDGYRYTLEEVGRIMGVTRERVRQLEKRAIKTLQRPTFSRLLVSHLPDQAIATEIIEEEKTLAELVELGKIPPRVNIGYY